MRYTYRYRSFIWPALLILAGVVALLVNTHQIPVERLGQLVDLWPVILVVVGLELIVRRAVHGVAGDVAAALIVLLAIAGATAYLTVAPAPSTKTYDSTAELGSVTKAALQVDVSGAKLVVSDTAASGELYRAHIEYSGADPRVQLDPGTGELLIDQRDQGLGAFQSRKFILTLQLSPAVVWSIGINSGAATVAMSLPNAHVDRISLNTGASTDEITLGAPSGINSGAATVAMSLPNAPVDRISLNTGASTDEITLGAPSGIVGVEVNGAALTVRVHRPAGTPASVEVSGLGLNLNVDGHSYHALGHVTASADLGAAGYRIQVNGAACNVAVDTNGGSD